MYTDDINLFAKLKKHLRLKKNNKNIQPRCRNKIWYRKMCNSHYENWKKRNNRRYGIIKSRKNKNAQRKGKLQILENIDADSIKQAIMWMYPHMRTWDYIKKNKKEQIKAANKITDNIKTNRTTKTRKQKWKEKQLYGYFKRQTSENSNKNTWTWLRKGNLKSDTESLIIAAQRNGRRTSCLKTQIDNIQRNCKYRLYGDGDETVNHIQSEWSKLVEKEYNIRHEWVGKVIHWELCQKFKFDYTIKCICTNQNPSWRMKHIKFSGNLRNKPYSYQPEKKKNLLYCGLCCFSRVKNIEGEETST